MVPVSVTGLIVFALSGKIVLLALSNPTELNSVERITGMTSSFPTSFAWR